MLELSIPEALQLAVSHHREGRKDLAETLYRRILAVQPGHADALNLLGTVMQDKGELEEASSLIGRAIEKSPSTASFHYNLGNVYFSQGAFESAVDSHARAIALQPAHAKAHNNLANALKQAGRLDEAAQHYQRAVELEPRLAVAWHNLGAIAAARDESDVAERHFRAALEHDPRCAESHIELARCLRARYQSGETVRKLDAVVSHYRQALALAPENAAVSAALAAALEEQGWIDEAAHHARRAVDLVPSQAPFHFLLAQILEKQDRPVEALAGVRRALELAPGDLRSLALHASLLRQLGRLDEAKACLHAMLDIKPGHAGAYYGLSMLQEAAENDALVPILEGGLDDSARPEREKIQLLFALGRCHDDNARHHEAFECWLQANGLVRAGLDYDVERDERRMQRIEAFFSRDFFRTARHAVATVEPSVTPVFVVGMPRSGTTLVEQILGSHPGILAAGELNRLALISTNLPRFLETEAPYPQCLADLSPAQAREVGDVYLDSLPTVEPGVRFICDKMPGNFLHLGLIALVLPHAKIIHCVRDPIDTCISCFSLHFAHGQHFSYDLHELGRYYGLYRGLMQHWAQALPLSILDVDYTDMVRDTERQTRRMLEFCGVDWSPECASFHHTERPVKTASSVQVRRPIYTRSLERWKRYEKYLAPLRAGLAVDGRRDEAVPGEPEPARHVGSVDGQERLDFE